MLQKFNKGYFTLYSYKIPTIFQLVGSEDDEDKQQNKNLALLGAVAQNTK